MKNKKAQCLFQSLIYVKKITETGNSSHTQTTYWVHLIYTQKYIGELERFNRCNIVDWYQWFIIDPDNIIDIILLITSTVVWWTYERNYN